MSNKLMPLDIQLFAEGSGGAETGADSSQPQSGGTNDAGIQSAGAPVAGEQNDGTEAVNSSDEVTLDSIYEKYPELKKEAEKRAKGMAQNAVKSKVSQMRKAMEPANNILDKMMVLHGVKTIEELDEKLGKTLSEEFAVKNGLSEDMGNEMFNLRLKDMRDDRMNELYQQQRQAARQVQAWEKDAEGVKAVYSDFDLNAELENPEFEKLLKVNGLSMKQAYELIHHNDLITNAEKRAEQAYANSVNANLSRPVENGTGSQGAVSNHSDVSKLTKKERAELAKRAQRGEVITFN